jgi:uncharacterized protein
LNSMYFSPGMMRNWKTVKSSTPMIEVEGSGTIKVKPNIVIIKVGVVTENKSAKTAQQQNSETSNRLIEALVNSGIKKDDIETISYTVTPVYEYHEKERVLKGYEVQHLFAVTVRDIEQTGSIYDVAFENGANVAGSPVFQVEPIEPFELQALQKAVSNAIPKAQIAVKTVGAVLNPVPLKITELSTSMFSPVQERVFKLAAETDTTPIQATELQIQARVRAQFTYHY